MIKLGRERGIPTVIIPYTIANAREPAEDATGTTRLIVSPGSATGCWASSTRNGCIFTGAESCFVFPPSGPSCSIATAWRTPKPWLFNSSNAAVIAVESDAVLDYYTRAGLPPEQFRVTGSLHLDRTSTGSAGSCPAAPAALSRVEPEDNGPLVLCICRPTDVPTVGRRVRSTPIRNSSLSGLALSGPYGIAPLW